MSNLDVNAIRSHAQAILDLTATSTPPVEPPPSGLPALQIERSVQFGADTRVYLVPFPGAMDYRASNGVLTVYAGGSFPSAPAEAIPTIPGVGPGIPHLQNPCIELPDAEDSEVWTIQAVDDLGPYQPPKPGRKILGGHGDSTNNPKAIAEAKLTTVRSRIQPSPGAEQVLIKTFDTPFTPVRIPTDPRIDPSLYGTCETYTGGGNLFRFYRDDPAKRQIFVENGGMNIVVSDIDGSNGTATFQDETYTADISGGKVLNVEVKVPPHLSTERKFYLYCIPAGEVLLKNDWAAHEQPPGQSPFSGPNGGVGLALSIFYNIMYLTLFDEGKQFTSPNTYLPPQYEIKNYRATPDGNPGSAHYHNYANCQQNGFNHGHVFRLLLSEERAVVTEDGVVMIDWTLPIPFDYTQIQTVWSQDAYHLGKDWGQANPVLSVFNPATGKDEPTGGIYGNEKELFIREHMKDYDERRWTNFKIEALPDFPA